MRQLPFHQKLKISMVQTKAQISLINIDQWLDVVMLSQEHRPLIKSAYDLAQSTAGNYQTPLGKNCVEQGLEIAAILIDLHFDTNTLAAAILYPAHELCDLPTENIANQLNHSVAKLIADVRQMNAIDKLWQKSSKNSPEQIDNIRKMLLTMVRDIRAVVIKLAERLVIMRALRNQNEKLKQQSAEETFAIFSPLANRLGLHQIKWELEDYAFRYFSPEEYQTIAERLNEQRQARTKRVDQFVSTIQKTLKVANIDSEVYGRAKHIYSIKRKMLQKTVPIEKIYDIHAIRILVSTIKDCYKTLSIIHELFEPIPQEFDDYIAHPKPNGYQSIHTAILDRDGKNFEVQIRTRKMHEEAEMGVAAHWAYKEGKKGLFEEKMNWLRHLLEWQKELTDDKTLPEELEKKIFEDRVYVFTPAGDIIDLPIGATPLDFAYHIHSEIGHRCRGAKINGHMIPLTQTVKTGDQIEILTNKTGGPSRDWLMTQNGYLKTSHARAKVSQWFKKEDIDLHIETGKNSLEKELNRLNLHNINFSEIASRLNYKTTDQLFAALGNGSIRLSQVIHQVSNKLIAECKTILPEEKLITPPKKTKHGEDGVTIHGVNNILLRIAKCCKPLPDDPIIGYITQSEGVAVHHRHCKNIVNIDPSHHDRLIEANWNQVQQKRYPADIEILANDRPNLIRDITTCLANYKINVHQLTTTVDHKINEAKFSLTIEISTLSELSKILANIRLIPNIYTVRRAQQEVIA